jgi:hypothetical protein
VYKWKARLNLHGGKQEYGLNFWETYSPVVTWATVRMMLILVTLNYRYRRSATSAVAPKATATRRKETLQESLTVPASAVVFL